LGRQEGQWDVVQMPGELPQDPQALANGYAREIEYGPDESITVVTAPIQFDQRDVVAPTRAPHHGADTDEVLSGIGLRTEDITRPRDRGVVAKTGDRSARDVPPCQTPVRAGLRRQSQDSFTDDVALNLVGATSDAVTRGAEHMGGPRIGAPLA
jgi:hypothetical protein